MKVSRKLIEGHDGDGPALFVVEGNPEQGYDLFQAHLVHVSHHQRSWQAVDAAATTIIASSFTKSICSSDPSNAMPGIDRCGLTVDAAGGQRTSRWPVTNGIASIAVHLSGAELIEQERQRQIDVEGWTPTHDDEHTDTEMRWAAACYLLSGHLTFEGYDFAERCWPWDRAWWKPSDDPIRNLVKAGALIAAEIDRLIRQGASDAAYFDKLDEAEDVGAGETEARDPDAPAWTPEAAAGGAVTAAAHVQAAIDELDAESSELRLLDEVAEQRSALVAWLRHVEQRDRVEPPAQASPRDTPDPASPAGPTATAGVPGPSGGTPATIESGRASESRTTTSPGEGAGRPTSARSARPAAPKSHKGGRRNRSDLGEVARVAREALAAGRPMRDAVAAHLGCGPSGAGQAITKARKAGHDIPPAPSGQAGAKLRKLSARPAPNADDLPAVEQRPVSSWSPKPGENVVVCDECGHVEPITGVSALNRHCLSQHRRAATVEERTPRPWEEQAA